jgi:hypothetical protein
MKRVRTIGLALTAVLAICAISATAATAALPEFSTSGTFTSTSGAGTLETTSPHETVKCKSDTTNGTFTSPKAVSKVEVAFKGCKATVLGFIEVECKTSGASAEEIRTTALKGSLGYLNAAKKEAGLELEPESTTFAAFECAGEKIEVKGHVICKLTPVNTKTSKLTLTCEQSGGVQKYTAFEGGPSSQILETKVASGSFRQSAEEATDSITTSPEGEIEA